MLNIYLKTNFLAANAPSLILRPKGHPERHDGAKEEKVVYDGAMVGDRYERSGRRA